MKGILVVIMIYMLVIMRCIIVFRFGFNGSNGVLFVWSVGVFCDMVNNRMA